MATSRLWRQWALARCSCAGRAPVGQGVLAWRLSLCIRLQMDGAGAAWDVQRQALPSAHGKNRGKRGGRETVHLLLSSVRLWPWAVLAGPVRRGQQKGERWRAGPVVWSRGLGRPARDAGL